MTNSEFQSKIAIAFWDLIHNQNELLSLANLASPAISKLTIPIEEEDDFDRLPKELKVRDFREILNVVNKKRESSERIFGKMVFILGISNFEAFCSDIFRSIFQKNLNSLSKKDFSMTFGKLLEFPDKESMIDYFVNLKVNELLFEPIETQFKLMDKMFGISVDEIQKESQKKHFRTEYQPDMDRVIEIFAARNIILHNRGIVNEMYLARCKNTPVKLGSIYPIEPKEIAGSLEYLSIFATQYYFAVSNKFAANV